HRRAAPCPCQSRRALRQPADRPRDLRPRHPLLAQAQAGRGRAAALAGGTRPRRLLGLVPLRALGQGLRLAARREPRDRLAPRRQRPRRQGRGAPPDRPPAGPRPRRQRARARPPDGRRGDHLGLLVLERRVAGLRGLFGAVLRRRGLFEGAGQDRLGGAEQHRHVAPLAGRALLDDRELLQLLGEPVEDRLAALGVGDLAPAEHDGDLHLVLVAQEALDVALLGVVVRRGDLRAELDLADRDLLLVLAGLLGLLGLLVLVLRVVEHPADRRARLRRDLDEVEVLLLGVAQRLLSGHDAHLPALLVDEADLGNADAFVDPGLVALRRSPVEPTRDRHSVVMRQELGQRATV